MKEKEKSRERERDDWEPSLEAFVRWMCLGPDQEEAGKSGRKLMRGKDNPWFENAQAYRAHFSVSPFQKGTVLDGKWMIAHHLIPSRSGKHTHQGGLVIFVVEGKGYTVIDGVRHDWKAGDMMMLPLKKGGIEHQHINIVEDKPSKWVMLTPMKLWEALGFLTQQNEVYQGFKGDPGVPLYMPKYPTEGEQR